MRIRITADFSGYPDGRSERVVEFEEHHIALFEQLTKPVAEALGRFAVRLARRESAIGWMRDWWKQILLCVGVGWGWGWGWAKWGHANLPDIKAALSWILAHLQ